MQRLRVEHVSGEFFYTVTQNRPSKNLIFGISYLQQHRTTLSISTCNKIYVEHMLFFMSMFICMEKVFLQLNSRQIESRVQICRH